MPCLRRNPKAGQHTGGDVVVHMAADSSGEKGWESVHQNNVVGSYHVFEACRLAGVNEVLAVILMAAKFGVPVCPHAGGVGLCEYVQHLSLFDYIAVSGSLHNRIAEYVDHLHEHFVYPVLIKDGRYLPPLDPGYSIEMKEASLERYEFPGGAAWKR